MNPPSDPLREYTARARAAIAAAYAYARDYGHPTVQPEHLLLGIASAGGSTANLLGIPPYRIHAEAQRLISTYAQDWPLSGEGSAGDELVELRQAVVRMHIREYHELIVEVRRQKQAAVQAGDHERAAELRQAEQRLLEEKTAQVTRWAQGLDVAVLVHELDRLYHELERLHQLLRRHQIRPDEPDAG